MDNLSGRLALALDPRFKRVALPEGKPFDALAVHVAKLLQRRGASLEVRALSALPDLSKQAPLPWRCSAVPDPRADPLSGAPQVAKRCMHEFIKYITGFAPYDMAHGGEFFNATAWWRGVKYAGNAELAVLAEVLFSVVPHSASVEQTFSDFGWCPSERRKRLDPDTIGKLATVKRALHNEARGASKRRAPSAAASEESDDEEGSDQEASPSGEELVAELEALAKRLAPLSKEAADLAADAALSRGEEPASFTELLMGNWDGFDVQAELHPGLVPDARATVVPGEEIGPMQAWDTAALFQ